MRNTDEYPISSYDLMVGIIERRSRMLTFFAINDILFSLRFENRVAVLMIISCGEMLTEMRRLPTD